MTTPQSTAPSIRPRIERRIGVWAGRPVVGIESTVFVHGLPKAEGLALADELTAMADAQGVALAIIGVVDGRPIVGLTQEELSQLIEAQAPKLNTANLGIALHQKTSGATTVSTTLELAALAGLRFIATGGLGGVHRGYADRLDISADLLALARFPVGVVCSGVKSILDIASTRELLESLGVPVIGIGTDRFPAFVVRQSAESIDARIDDPDQLAALLIAELNRVPTRGVLLAQPIPEADAIEQAQFDAWLKASDQLAGQAAEGRDATPSQLEALRVVSGGKTLEANLALLRSNAGMACRIALKMHALRVR